MDNIWIAVFIIGGFLASVLAILLLRGRFGTAARQGRYDLTELAASDEVPRGARREIATCRGHSLDSKAIFGAGVLWLNDDTLGFVLRTPRRHIRIDRALIDSVTASSTYARPGIVEESDVEDFLIVRWESERGPETICFQVPDPSDWIAQIDNVRS